LLQASQVTLWIAPAGLVVYDLETLAQRLGQLC
jgi:hypothetical protein